MGDIYGYIKDLCNCTYIRSSGVGDNSSAYDYLNELCNGECAVSSAGDDSNIYDSQNALCLCECVPVYLTIKSVGGDEPATWPIKVFNVNQVDIGTAANKAEFISIWNADPDNRLIGKIKNGTGPFGFMIMPVECNDYPGWLFGESMIAEMGIITEDGIQIISEDGEPLITE